MSASDPRLTVIPSTVEEWEQVRRWLGLSERQIELVQYLFKGGKLELIALEMNLGHGTVKTYQQRIYQKLRISERGQLILTVADAHLRVNLMPRFRQSAS